MLYQLKKTFLLGTFSGIALALVVGYQNFSTATVSDDIVTDPLVFDCGYYIKHNASDPAMNCGQAKQEFISTIKLGKTIKAHPLFSVEEYFRLHLDIREKFRLRPDLAIQHYVEVGYASDHRGLLTLSRTLFDCEYYLNRYPDLKDLSCDRLKLHWVRSGAKAGRIASEKFSMPDFLKVKKPHLGEFFGSNFELAWHYYINFEAHKPFELIPLNVDQSKLFEPTATEIFTISSKSSAFEELKMVIEKLRISDSGKQRIIRFLPGKYYIECSASAATNCFEIDGLSNVIFSGDKSKETKIVLVNPEKGFLKLTNSKNVFFQNITIDYEIAPFVQGKILSVDLENRTIDFEIDDRFDHIGVNILNKYLWNSFGFLMDSKIPERKLNSDTFFRASTVDVLSERVWKFKLDSIDSKYPIEQAKVEDRLVFPISVPGGTGISFIDSENVGMNHVIFQAGFVNYIIRCQGNILINNVIVRRQPGSDRLISLSRGNFNASDNRSPILLQNSYFEGTGDDAFNLNASEGYVSEIDLVNRKIRVRSTSEIKPNDVLQFVDPYVGRHLKDLKVLEISKTGWITLENVDEFVSGTRQAPGTMFFNLNSSGFGSIFRNNIFGPNRRAQILIRSNVLVEDNRFLRSDSNAILAHVNLAGVGRNGPLINNLDIKRNIFDQGKTPDAMLVKFHFNTLDGKEAVVGDGTINLEDNTFNNCSVFCAGFSGFRNLKMIRNSVVSDSSKKRLVGSEANRPFYFNENVNVLSDGIANEDYRP